MKLEGRVALVTGASRGIGYAIAEALAQEGADVALNDLAVTQETEDVKTCIEEMGRRAMTAQADVADQEQVQSMVDRVVREWGHIDILVNNAGICDFMPFGEITREVWERTIGVDLSGSFYVAQAVARQMVKQGRGGKILQITSIGAYASNPTQVHYCAAKGGAELLAKGMALELAPYNIQVNCIAPGTTLTDINREFFSDPEQRKRYEQRIPAGRLGTPQDIAAAAVFLASDDASYITGTTIVVDGGHLAGLF